MNWAPYWQRQKSASDYKLSKKQKLVNVGWQPWFAWRPVTANYSRGIQYWSSERRVWLERIERKLIYKNESYAWIYYIEKPEANK